MALVGKERAVSSTPSTTTIGTSVIVTDLITNIFKVSVPKIAKSEPFYGSR
jgi:hypothetical protein